MMETETNSLIHRTEGRPEKTWLFAMVHALAAFGAIFVLLRLIQMVHLDQWVMILAPVALSGFLAFLLCPGLGLAAWILLSGLVPVPLIGGEIFLYDLFTAVLMVLWMIRIIRQGRLRFEKPDGVVLAVLGVAFFSVLINLHRQPEVEELFFRDRGMVVSFTLKNNISALIVWSIYGLAYFFASRLPVSRKQVLFLLGILFLMGIINSSYALWHWSESPLGFSRQNRTMGLLEAQQDQGYLSAFLVIGVMVFLAFRVVKGMGAFLIGGFGLLVLLNLIFNFTRLAYLEFALGVMIIVYFSRSRRLMIGVLIAALVVGLIFASVQIERGALKFITEAGSRKGAGLPLRMTTWKDALRMAREDGGVFGVGIGNYQAYSEAKVTFSNLRHIRLASAHSMFLQILAEQGLPGVIAWMAFFVVLIRYFLRNLKRSEAGDNIRRAINLWLLAATAMVAVDGFMYMDFLPPAYAHGSLTAGYYVWIAMGLAVAYNRLDTNPPGESLWR